MMLYTKYGIVEGTVDEILEYLNKQDKIVQTSGTNFSEEIGACELEIEKENK